MGENCVHFIRNNFNKIAVGIEPLLLVHLLLFHRVKELHAHKLTCASMGENRLQGCPRHLSKQHRVPSFLPPLRPRCGMNRVFLSKIFLGLLTLFHGEVQCLSRWGGSFTYVSHHTSFEVLYRISYLASMGGSSTSSWNNFPLPSSIG